MHFMISGTWKASHTSLMGMCEIAFTLTMKPFNTLKVKSALVKSVYCIAEWTIYNHDIVVVSV